MEHSSGVPSSNEERQRPFAVVPAAAAGLRLLIVNPVYFLWPLALLFVVLVLGPSVGFGIEQVAPPAPVEQVEPAGEPADEAAESAGESAGETAGFGACRATAPGADDADLLSRGGSPKSPPAALFALVLALATAGVFVTVQASVFRLVTGRVVSSGAALRFGSDELRLAAVNLVVPLACASVAAPMVIVGLGVQWLPGPCVAVNGVATVLFVAGGVAALGVLVRLALVGPAVIAERRLSAWRSGVAASRDVIDLITMSSVAGVASSALLVAPVIVVMSLISGGGPGGPGGGPSRGGPPGGGPTGGGPPGGGRGGAGGLPDTDPVAAVPIHIATMLAVFLFLVTLSAMAAYAYVRVTRGADPDALAITPEESA